MRVGFNIGADGKYAFDKNGNFRGVLGFAYNSIINPVEYSSGLGSYKYKPTINILTLSLGGEYAITPKKKSAGFLVSILQQIFSAVPSIMTLRSLYCLMYHLNQQQGLVSILESEVIFLFLKALDW